MVNTVKFSEFAVAPLTSGGNEVVGLESGVNVQSTRFLTWTTAGRPATPFNGLLGINTSLQQYEFWDSMAVAWIQLADTNIFTILASHAAGQGASFIGLQDQSNVTSKTVQDLANATILTLSNNGTIQNGSVLTAGSGVTFTPSAGVLTISATGTGGTVTSVDTGAGLTGGAITTTGTISLAAIADHTLLANISGGALAPSSTTLTALIDNAIGSTQGDILYRNASAWVVLAPGTSGQVFQTKGAAANPAYSTPTYPSASGSAGLILRSDGTNNVYSTSTFADTYLINTIPFAGSANTIAGATLSSIIDASIGSTQGDILYRNASAWVVLPPGTAGYALLTGGAAANLSYSNSLTSYTLVTPASLGVQQQALNMNSHLINNVSEPINPQDVATRNYVDQTALNGTSVYAASAATLGTVTQAGSGVGATLTNAGAQATFALDGVNPPVGVNVLIKNTATGMTAANEGMYTVSNAGSNSTNWVLTRATTYDTAPEINRTGLIIILNGTQAGQAWYNTTTIVTVDTTNFNYASFGSTGTVTSVATGSGLTGGPITTTGTISLASIADHTLLANISGGSLAPSSTTLTALIDNAIGSTQGNILYRNASAWVVLPPGTAGYVLQTGGAAANPSWTSGLVSNAINKVTSQVFTSSGTYTPTTGMVYCTMEAVAGGGGSGGSTGGAGTPGVSGGGGGGGYARAIKTAAQVGVSQTITIGNGGTAGASGTNAGGNGGTTSVGTLCVATGGLGSVGGTGSAAITITAGGAGSSGTAGDFFVNGSDGGYGLQLSAAVSVGGVGGASHFGGGIQNSAGSAAGVAGYVYGGGAAGCNPSNANAAGGVGGKGIVVITEFCSV